MNIENVIHGTLVAIVLCFTIYCLSSCKQNQDNQYRIAEEQALVLNRVVV